MHFQKGSLEAVLGQVGKIVKFRNTVVGKGGFMKAIRYFVAILLFCGLGLGLEAAERPGKAKKEKKPVPEYEFKRFYADISVGYAFRLGANEIDGMLNNGDLIMIQMFNPLDCANVGKGLRVGVNFGLNFNRYVGLELDGGYMAYPQEIVSTDRGGGLGFDDDNEENDGIASMYFTGLGLDAQRGYLSVQMKASPGFVRVNPYAKVGIGTIIGRLEHSASLTTYDGYIADEDVLYKAEYKGKRNFFMLGFVGALGVDFYISPMLTFFLEWQAGMYSTSWFNWRDGKFREEGKLEADIFAGDEDVFGNSHGLNFGIKFKF